MMKRLRSTWLDRWSPAIESAVQLLPEAELCPRDLHLSLLERNLAAGGRVALVEHAGEPAAVIGLEREGRLRWRTSTSWLVPHFVCAAADDMVLPAIGSLDAEIAVGWWGMPVEPSHPTIRETHVKPTSRLAVSERESFWRSNKMWHTIVRARNRCASLQLRIDEPSDAEWVVRSWAEKWSTPENPRPRRTAEAQIEIARRLTPAGRYVTLVLHDDGRPLVGATSFIDGEICIAGVLFRDESVGNLPTGVRIIDESFQYAEQAGIRELNLGGGYSYKSKWAPTVGADLDIVLAPTMRHLAYKLTRALRG